MADRAPGAESDSGLAGRPGPRDRPPARVAARVVFLGGGCAVSGSSSLAGVGPLAALRTGLLAIALAATSSTLVRRVLRRGPGVRRVVVVGSQESVTTYTDASDSHLVVGALLSDQDPEGSLPFPTTRSVDSLPDLVAEVGAEAVLVLGRAGGPVRELTAPRAATRLAAAALLLVTAPLLLLLWTAVRLDSPGSGFHVSTRVRHDGRTFGMLSLRTMREDAGSLADVFAEDSAELAFVVRRDPRVTRVGFWLRRWSLDRLPRLVNVLRGEMLLRGPSPL